MRGQSTLRSLQLHSHGGGSSVRAQEVGVERMSRKKEDEDIPDAETQIIKSFGSIL